MNKKILYHGSPEIIEEPMLNKGNLYNDYGRGFYMTEHVELAREWACTGQNIGYANRYEIDLDSLNILNLNDRKFTVLHWLAILMEYRRVRLFTPVMERGVSWLKANFLIDISPFDLIIGYRADDSYFSFARAFVNNEISIKQLSNAMRLGKLGIQYVLKSEKAFANIKFVDYTVAEGSEYYAKRKNRDEMARQIYLKELEEDDIEGLFMRDIIREKVKPDDSRLQY